MTHRVIPREPGERRDLLSMPVVNHQHQKGDPDTLRVRDDKH